MEEKTFKKRSGTTDRGKDYEHLIVADLILKAIADNNIKDFNLSSNDDKFGSFDDVVLDVEFASETKKVYALQLKHITKEKILTKSALMENRGNFSIKRYFGDFKEMKDFTGAKFVLFTNHKFHTRNGEIIDIKGEAYEGFKVKIFKIPCESLLNTSSQGCCYKFELVETELATNSTQSDEYRRFFNDFFLYTNQASVDNLREEMSKRFQEIFCCHEGLFKEYIDFVTKWSIREGEKMKLDKTVMKLVIAIRLLSPFIEPFRFSNVAVNEQSQLLRQAIFEFNVTIFNKDNCDDVKKIYGDIKSQIQNIDEINKTLNKYELISKNIKDVNELNDEQTTMLLWVLGKCPLIVPKNNITYKAINLCPNARFILLKTDSSEVNLEKSKIFRNLSDLPEESEIYGRILNSFQCSLQGKAKITLQTFIEQSEEIRNIITANELVEMLNESFTIGGEKEVLPIPQIGRMVSTNIIDSKFFNQVQKDSPIIISCQGKLDKIKTYITDFNTIKVEEYLRKEKTDSSTIKEDNFSNTSSSEKVKKEVYISENICSQLEFNEICKKNSHKKNCHQFQIVDNGVLEWIRSKPDIAELNEYRHSGHFMEEKKLFDFDTDNSIEIVCADAGMGKSTLARNIKNHHSPTSWTILIYAKEHSSYFNEKNHDVNDFIKYILDKTHKDQGDFSLKLVHILKKQRKIAFIWDGLDEIFNDNLQTVMDIIDELSKRCFKQLITSRMNLKKNLESRFKVFSRTINPFDELQQNNYIKDRLRGKLSETELEDIVMKINKNVKMARYNDILGIPLQIFMLTELFRQDKEKYNTLLNDKFSIADLYHHFVDEKFNVYYDTKLNLDTTGDAAKQFIVRNKIIEIKEYEKAALKAFFTTQSLNDLNINCETYLDAIHKEGDCFGIIKDVTTEGTPNFLHNSYGEYFAATYLYTNYNKIPRLKQLIFDERYRNIRFLLDLLLAKNCPMHIAVLNKNSGALLKHKNQPNCKDQGGRNVLQLACSWGQRYPLLNTQQIDEIHLIDDAEGNSVGEENWEYEAILEILCKKYDPYEVDELFNLNSFCYADKSLCLLPIIMLSHIHKVNFNDLQNFKHISTVLYYSVKLDHPEIFNIIDTVPIIKTKQEHNSLLHLSAKYNATHCLRKMLSKYEFRKEINTKNKHGRTPIYIACWNAHILIVYMLIDANADVNVADVESYSPMYVACQSGHIKIVRALIDHKANINVVDINGHTPMWTSSFNGHFKIVQMLINAKADVNLADNKGFTPLYVACQNGYTQVVQLLVDAGAAINTRNKDGNPPIQIACVKGHYEIARLLISHKAAINTVDEDGDTPLHDACSNEHTKIISLLIDAGADINIANKVGLTPLDLARKKEHSEMLQLLNSRID